MIAHRAPETQPNCVAHTATHQFVRDRYPLFSGSTTNPPPPLFTNVPLFALFRTLLSQRSCGQGRLYRPMISSCGDHVRGAAPGTQEDVGQDWPDSLALPLRFFASSHGFGLVLVSHSAPT